AMFGGGTAWFTRGGSAYAIDIASRNPQLEGNLEFVGPDPMAPSQPDAVPWLVTRYLATLAPHDFVDPSQVPPAPRHATAALATATPSYAGAITLLTGRPPLAKALDSAFLSPQPGPVWVMTDLATAFALGMEPAALENSTGQFVAPTADTIN